MAYGEEIGTFLLFIPTEFGGCSFIESCATKFLNIK